MELPKRKEVPELLRPYRDIRHSYSVFGVNQLALLDDDAAAGTPLMRVSFPSYDDVCPLFSGVLCAISFGPSGVYV